MCTADDGSADRAIGHASIVGDLEFEHQILLARNGPHSLHNLPSEKFAVNHESCSVIEMCFGESANVPEGVELRTDHGPQYTGADCEARCTRWRLTHTYAPVGRPTGNAVAERFIRTLKEELIWLRDWESAEELRAAVAIWLDHYNHHRPHQALNWQTPAERRTERLAMSIAHAA